MSITKVGKFTKFTLNIALLIILMMVSCEDEIPVLELVEITGVVEEVNSSQPVAGISVAILTEETISPQLTGNNGSFKFSGLRLDDGTYEMQASSSDYVDEKIVFTIENGKQTENIRIGLIASEVLSFDQGVLDFGSGTEEIDLEITNTSSATQTFSLSSEASWLSFAEEEISLGSEASESITFAVDRELAAIGSFEESVVFEVEGRPSQTIVVKMQKLDPTSGILELNKTSVDFGKASENQLVTISNSGQSTLNWTAVSSESWISIPTSAGAIEPNEDFDFSVVVIRDDLENGLYESAVSFGGDGGTATITVIMEVDNSVGLLQLSTTSLDLGLVDQSIQVTLSNGGSNTLEWSATINDSWISLDQTSGSLEVGANSTLTVTVDRSALSAGSFEGSVDFSSNGEISTLAIAMEVQGGVLAISETTLNLGSAESNKVIEFSNVGMRPLTWTSNENTPWLNIAPKEGTIEVDASSSVLIEVDRTGLGLGDYSASIQIDSENQSNTITINMSVAQDTDMDGVPDEVDADFDGDGLIEVYTINDLNDIREDLDASGDGKQGAPSGGFIGFELMNDLDFDSDSDYDDLSLKVDVTSGLGWEPIGYNASGGFKAVFEGNDFTVRNLFINRTTDNVAFFEFAEFLSEIRNLHIEIRFLSGERYTAGLVGFSRANISNCSVVGDISASTNYAGLLIGLHDQGIIENSWAEGNVLTTGRYVGGFIGQIGDGTFSDSWRISNCYAIVNISGGSDIGGFVGYVRISNGTIESCYAKGNVSSPSASSNLRAGGFIGIGAGEIKNCYATGNVTSAATPTGGFAGSLSNGSIVSSYSIGAVTGPSGSGGFIDSNSGSVPTTNYWNTETSGLATSGGGSGQTTSQLQSPTSADGIYITWGSSAWDYGTSTQYPALKDMPNGLDPQRD